MVVGAEKCKAGLMRAACLLGLRGSGKARECKCNPPVL